MDIYSNIENRRNNIIRYTHNFSSIWYAAGIIIFNSDLTKTIIVKTPSGNIGFPKGGKENKERLHQTAYREVKEETSLKTFQYEHDNTLIGEKKGNPNKGPFTIYYFIAKIKNKETENIQLKCSIPNELSFVNWVPIQEALNMLSNRRKEILLKAHNYITEKYNNINNIDIINNNTDNTNNINCLNVEINKIEL